MDFNQTLTNWVWKLSNGDERAMEVVFAKYFDRLIQLAIQKMHGLNQTVYSGEDAAVSAVKSLWNGIQKQQFDFTSEGELWSCLFKITTRKACAERRRQMAHKAGGGKVIISGDASIDEDSGNLFDTIVGDETPSPELALQVAECGERLLKMLDRFPTHKKIVQLKLEGYTENEIAQKLGLLVQTIYRDIREIAEKWRFVQAMEFVIDNILDESLCRWENVALDISCSSEMVKQTLQFMVNSWGEEPENAKFVQVLTDRIFSPDKYLQLYNGHDSIVMALESLLSKIARQWTNNVYGSWNKKLFKIWKTNL